MKGLNLIEKFNYFSKQYLDTFNSKNTTPRYSSIPISFNACNSLKQGVVSFVNQNRVSNPDII